jgi:retron-type reverse transcriptase
MKRIGNLYEKIYLLDNLLLADKNASKGKSRQYGVIQHRKNKIENILKLQDMLINKTYKTSEYYIFRIEEPKLRTIHRLPYYPDRILQHAVLNILAPIFIKSFTADTYSCVPGRGIHKASYKLRKAIKGISRERESFMF